MSNRPVLPRWQFESPTGAPLSGGKLYWYLSGTSTPAVTYADAALTVPHPNPIILNAAGYAPDIFVAPGLYKVTLTDAADVPIWTSDPVTPLGVAPPLSPALQCEFRSANFTIDTTQNGFVFFCSGNITVSFQSAATLGLGFSCRVQNVGSGVVTLDPFGSETIDGSQTKVLPPRFGGMVICTGSEFLTQGVPDEVIIARREISSPTSSFTWPLPTQGVYRLNCWNVSTTATANLTLQCSSDGGSTFFTSATHYRNAAAYNAGSTPVAYAGTIGSILLAPQSAASELINSRCEMFTGSPSRPFSVWDGGARTFDGAADTAYNFSARTTFNGTMNAVRVNTSAGQLASGTFILSQVRE